MRPFIRIAFHAAGVALLLAVCAPLCRAAEPESSLLSGTVTDIFKKGGICMYPIVAGSVIGLALAFERLVSLRRSSLVPKDLVGGVRDALRTGDVDAVARLVDGRDVPLARILSAGLRNRDLGAEQVERVMESTGALEVSRLKRPVKPIAILATVEPLLGLLGTVLGMISTFNVLHRTTVANRVETLAPGIGQALYTTVGGLVVAIPFVLLHSWLVGRVNRAADEWSSLGTDLVTGLTRRQAPPPAGGAAS